MNKNYNKDLLDCLNIIDYSKKISEYKILNLILTLHCKKTKGLYLITSIRFIKLYFNGNFPDPKDLCVSKNDILSFVKNNIIDYVLTSEIYSDNIIQNINVN